MNPHDSMPAPEPVLPNPVPMLPINPAMSVPFAQPSVAQYPHPQSAQLPLPVAPIAHQPPPPAVNKNTTDTSNIVVPKTADDTDLIEKEWVDRAKSIVNSNQDDPYKQSLELGLLKMEYLKKRYNRDVRKTE